MALRFAGKHAAIVGASGTIGSAIAKALASNGAAVTLLGRSVLDIKSQLEDQLTPPASASASPSTSSNAASSQLDAKRRVPSRHRSLKLDVLSAADIRRVFSPERSSVDAEEHVGSVDILVNCAGIAQTTLLRNTPDEELRNVVDTNLMAAMLASKYAKMRSHGCIINVSSLMANKGIPGVTAYAATKAGLIGFTRTLSLELGPRRIRVNALLPGWVESKMWDNIKSSIKQDYLKSTPLSRVATPEEIADAAVFLASNEYANNCVLNLDGGLSAS